MQENLEKNQTNLMFQGHIIASKFSLDEKKIKERLIKAHFKNCFGVCN